MLAGSIMLWAVTDVFFDTLWNVMWRNVWRSYKHIDKEAHCENILYQGHKGNKGRRMLEERWTVLAANEKMTQVDTISINMLWKIALVLFLCETLVWETTQRAALFWSINFNTLTFEASFYFWTRRTIWSPTIWWPRRDRRQGCTVEGQFRDETHLSSTHGTE